MQQAEELSKRIGRKAACTALGVPRSSLYRSNQPHQEPNVAKISPRALSAAEREVVRQELNSGRFVDCAPREVYATLMDEARYLCSWRSMYRILS